LIQPIYLALLEILKLLHRMKHPMENLPSTKGLAILGSTGNIGVQALEVMAMHSEYFHLIILTAGSDVNLLIEQSKKHQPEMVFIYDETKRKTLKEKLHLENCIVLSSEKELFQAFKQEDLHIVLMAMLGFSGLLPTLAAVEAGKDIAIANKESLVVGGSLIMPQVREKNIHFIPVDSEHSAIFQSLLGEKTSEIEKIILTASGGPFLNRETKDIEKIQLHEALQHPTWQMGKKISIDSASMMNKGLEVIEAKWLFHLMPHQIEVVIHPQSVIHSMVQFIDGSIKAQMGNPDMRGPIHFALFYPHRIHSPLTRFNFLGYPSLSFQAITIKKFRNLALAFEALEKGGNMPAILNAANEVAVDAVLKEKLSFNRISEVIATMMTQMDFISNPALNDLQASHWETIQKTKELISRKY